MVSSLEQGFLAAPLGFGSSKFTLTPLPPLNHSSSIFICPVSFKAILRNTGEEKLVQYFQSENPWWQASGTTQMSSSDGVWWGVMHAAVSQNWVGPGLPQLQLSCWHRGLKILLSPNTYHVPVDWDCFLCWLVPALLRSKLWLEPGHHLWWGKWLLEGQMQKLGLQMWMAY